MDKLGPNGLAAVVDFFDGLRRGGGGIHLFVTDRPQALHAELVARTPQGWVTEPLFADSGDRLHERAYKPLAKQRLLLLGEVDRTQSDCGDQLRALNTDREWLLRDGVAAALLVVGRDAADADEGHLSVQAAAPDFWSVRSQTHRVVGADPNEAALSRVLDKLSPLFHGDRYAARLWLDSRDFEADWTKYRLWRNGPAPTKWLAQVPALVEAHHDLQSGRFIEPEFETPWSSSERQRTDPLGPPADNAQWPTPVWPPGHQRQGEHALVTALQAQLDAQGHATVHCLPSEPIAALERAILTVGLLRESRYDTTLHIDGSRGLGHAITELLRIVGIELNANDLPTAARRLAGALDGTRVLVLATHVSRIEHNLLRRYLHRPTIALIRDRPYATFCVCASPENLEFQRWARENLRGWPLGATEQTLEGPTALLNLRAALSRSQYVVAIWDETWARQGPEFQRLLRSEAGRMPVVSVGSTAPADLSRFANWRGPLGPDEFTAMERLHEIATGVAGAPLHRTAPATASWPRPDSSVGEKTEHPSNDRIAMVFINGQLHCSGYLVDNRHVLSAFSALESPTTIQVRVLDHEQRINARIQWPQPPDGPRGESPILLRLERPVHTSSSEPQWASVGSSNLKCSARGVGHDVGSPEPWKLQGSVDLSTGGRGGRLHIIDLSGQPPSYARYNGIRGAALFARGLLIGVARGQISSTIEAWRAANLADDPSFVRALGRTVSVRTEPLWPSVDRPIVRSLRRFTPRIPTAARSPSELLDPTYETVAFEGRQRETQLLHDFVYGDGRDGALVITGPGGAGKTRLMLEWCRRLRARGWLAGFLKRELPGDLSPHVQGVHPRLVVLDYAEIDPVATTGIVRAMLQRDTGPKMRIVMLAREAGPWLRDLREESEVIDDCIAANPIVRLQPLYDSPSERTRGLNHAREHFYRIGELGADDPSASPPEPSLAHKSIEGRALYVHMQALLQVYGDANADALTPPEVLNQVLVHERRFWRKQLDPENERPTPRIMKGAERCAAAVVLYGQTASVTAALELFESVTTRELTDAERRQVLDCFSAMYGVGSAPGVIAPIEPDLLGETLLAGVFDQLDEATQDRWLARPLDETVPDAELTRALTVLTRLADREIGLPWLRRMLATHGEAIVRQALRTANAKEPNPPGSVFEQAIHHLDDADVAAGLSASIPIETVELRESAVAASERAVKLGRLGQRSPEWLARALNDLGNAYKGVGRREDALAATQEAVDSCRTLAEARPDAFLPDLARALNNLGMMLNGVGRREDALAAAQEAVDSCRTIAEARPDAFLPDLARALNNLGMMLNGVGRKEDALAATLEAVEIRRTLAEARPDAFLPDLARALNNLGNAYDGVGRREDALAAALEAVHTYRTLAEARPDAFLPDLATALNNLGTCFNGVGRRQDALAATLEAVDTYRTLAEARPDAFLPDLALALNNLGTDLDGVGRRQDALAATLEAVDIRRALAEARPDALVPDLATSLGTHGSILLAMGSNADAAGKFAEGLRLLLPYFHQYPDALRGKAAALAHHLKTASEAANLPIPPDLAQTVNSLT